MTLPRPRREAFADDASYMTAVQHWASLVRREQAEAARARLALRTDARGVTHRIEIDTNLHAAISRGFIIERHALLRSRRLANCYYQACRRLQRPYICVAMRNATLANLRADFDPCDWIPDPATWKALHGEALQALLRRNHRKGVVFWPLEPHLWTNAGAIGLYPADAMMLAQDIWQRVNEHHRSVSFLDAMLGDETR